VTATLSVYHNGIIECVHEPVTGVQSSFCTFLTANRDEMRETIAVDSWMDYHSLSFLISCSSSTKVLSKVLEFTVVTSTMEPGCLLFLIAAKMQSAKITIPKAIISITKIGIAFSKPCYLGSAGLSLRDFRHFLHSQHAFLPLLYRRRAIVKLQSAIPYLRRDRPACKPP
jgi:hypothetical protein